MTSADGFQLYAGDGSTVAQRSTRLPLLETPAALDDPAGYMAEEGLRDAVNVALALGQPLLLTGEPGTGKTQLAGSVANELGLPAPLVYNTKSTSTARDLFYQYDALRHFHDAQFRPGETTADQYISYEALGLAILLAMEPGSASALLPEQLRGKGPARSVVLLDEIDKAPRDLPNDVLNEIEEMSFTVRETGRRFAADRRYRPILILTSNSEKTLPDAFLRRCVFYHLTFPSRERLIQIVQRRLGGSTQLSPAMVEQAVRHFEKIRELGLRKRPSTAEFLAWLRVLDRLHIDLSDLKPGQREAIAFSYSILAKSQEDLRYLQEQLPG
jgi:MoxR-like ATPase